MIDGLQMYQPMHTDNLRERNKTPKPEGQDNGSGKPDNVGGADTSVDWGVEFTDKKENNVSINDFLNLMVAQLQNQDFMNPVDDTQYITQMAQFATMQQMQEMAEYSKTNYVMSLIGKDVTAAKFSVSGNLHKETGKVEKISLVNSEFMVYVNGRSFKLSEIMELHDSNSSSGNKEDMQYLLSLVGKTVTVQKRNEEGEKDGKLTGKVDKISTEDGKYQVYVEGKWYPLDDVLEVGNETESDGGMQEIQPPVNGDNSTKPENPEGSEEQSPAIEDIQPRWLF